MAGLILETTFLIDYEREDARGAHGPAHQFIHANEREEFCITPTVAGELAAGESLRRREAWDGFLTGFRVLGMSPEVSWKYGETYRYLQANGLMIGVNDLWIAAAGLAYAMPVVTRNRRDFERVPGLEVIAYAA